VATVDAPGDFDTHDDQAPTLVRDLAQLSQGLSAFQADLEARGIADRVLTFVWSEFGRRPKSNRSGGTDHGAGGIAWVQGTRAVSGILTDFPDLRRLDEHDNLAVTVSGWAATRRRSCPTPRERGGCRSCVSAAARPRTARPVR
jgi:uncharacterized protein (DUF1501 family)